MQYRLIGDTHGKWNRYKNIIKNCENSIQVGDFGVGFKYYDIVEETIKFSSNPPFDAMKQGNHRFIRGNHDNPEVCRNQLFWIPDGTIENNILFIGGAKSIDRQYRTEGLDWWPDEELSYSELDKIIDEAIKTKPSVVISHSCPGNLFKELFPNIPFFDKKSITEQAFDVLFDRVKPKLWVFGHFHISVDKEINDTRFICLNELEYKDLDL